jgi:hypothetical protein
MTSLTLGTRVSVVIVRHTVARVVGGAQAGTSTAVEARRACAGVNHCVQNIALSITISVTLLLYYKSIIKTKIKFEMTRLVLRGEVLVSNLRVWHLSPL